MSVGPSVGPNAAAEPRRNDGSLLQTHRGGHGGRFAIAVCGLAGALALALLARSMRPQASLPNYGHLPSFRLINERAVPFTSESMLGHASVVDFVFTRCTSSCPRLTARMAELQSRLEHEKSGIRLVSFSVDPDNDTPQVLAEYAARAHADRARWSFVTGPFDDVERAVVVGFKVAAAKRAQGANEYDVVHGDWFVLVDRQANVRGYYPTLESDEFEKLVRDALRLEREKTR
jgi:protein SCO1/2